MAAEIVVHAFVAELRQMRKSSYKADLNVTAASQLERYYKDRNELTLKIQMALGVIITADLVLNIDWDIIFNKY